jgi:YgiT-type zinc finger domain-containing protein
MRNVHTPQTQPCTDCQAGQMHLSYLTYYTWLADELITVPQFPAWICDVCGKREYDNHAVQQLTLLLNPNAGRPSSPNPRTARRAIAGGKSQPPAQE